MSRTQIKIGQTTEDLNDARLPNTLGTAGQALVMNSAGTGIEWGSAGSTPAGSVSISFSVGSTIESRIASSGNSVCYQDSPLLVQYDIGSTERKFSMPISVRVDMNPDNHAAATSGFSAENLSFVDFVNSNNLQFSRTVGDVTYYGTKACNFIIFSGKVSSSSLADDGVAVGSTTLAAGSQLKAKGLKLVGDVLTPFEEIFSPNFTPPTSARHLTYKLAKAADDLVLYFTVEAVSG